MTISDDGFPSPPDCKGCVFPGNCSCFDPKEVTVQVDTLRILLHWAIRAGAEDGLYSVRKAVAAARKAMEQ